MHKTSASKRPRSAQEEADACREAAVCVDNAWKQVDDAGYKMHAAKRVMSRILEASSSDSCFELKAAIMAAEEAKKLHGEARGNWKLMRSMQRAEEQERAWGVWQRASAAKAEVAWQKALQEREELLMRATWAEKKACAAELELRREADEAEADGDENGESLAQHREEAVAWATLKKDEGWERYMTAMEARIVIERSWPQPQE